MRTALLPTRVAPEPAVRPDPGPAPGSGSPRLTISALTRRFGTFTALDRVALDVAAGEVLAVLGPSGSGKSTLLRLVAGLDRPSAGTVAIDGLTVATAGTFVEPEYRRVGLVFQDDALFPHLSVAANVAFGLTPRSGPEADRVVRELLDRIGLGGRGGDYPHHLSGGERQRVALARALAPRPRLLLMDEPFTSLDGTLRGRLRAETVALLRETRTTTVLVTHDADEALRVADRVALIDRGRLVECGTPHALYARPATVAAARLFGEVNEIRGICRQGRVHTPIGCFDAPDLADRAPVSVCIRPSHVRLGSTPTGAEALVLSRAFLGHEDRITVAVPGLADPVAIRVPPGTRLEIDDVVRLDVDPAGVVLVSHVADSSSTPLDIQGV